MSVFKNNIEEQIAKDICKGNNECSCTEKDGHCWTVLSVARRLAEQGYIPPTMNKENEICYEAPEAIPKGRQLRDKVIDYINRARIKHLEIKDDMLYEEGTIFYSNSNNGTSFSWEMNRCTCDFVVGYKSTRLGYIRAWLRRDGTIKGYLYLDEGRSDAIELEEEYIGEDEARYFASLLHLEADEKKLWDKPITQIDFDREVTDDELLCPIW